jgi:hypothetical protein
VEDADYERALRVLEEGPDVAAELPPNSPEDTGTTPLGLFFAGLVALMLLAFAVHQLAEERRTMHPSQLHSYARDYNHDGKPDHFYTYRDGRIIKAEVDRNFDGKIDEWVFYDSEGRPEHAEYDNNFDGRPDVWYFYQNGSLARVERDADFNGQPDWFSTYENGIVVRADCRPNGSKIVIRRVIYEHGILREEWVDEDGDGKFDYKILRDPFGGTSERIPIDSEK